MASILKHFVTVEEYLALEEQSEERHEYLDGEVFAMAGATLAHADIVGEIFTAFFNQLRGCDCRVRGSDVRIRTSPTGLNSYADVVVSCQPDQVDGNTLLNPVVIVEVLSESTGSYDRSEKFRRYRQIPSFREYIVVAQSEVYLEHHVRDEAGTPGTWTMRELRSKEDVLTLRSVPVSLPVSTIYSRIDL